MSRFVESGVYGRTYTPREVAAYARRFGHGDEPLGRMEAQVRQLALAWRRVRLRVADLQTLYDEVPGDDPAIADYVERRRRGSRFPAVVVHDVRYLPADGNHRVRAVQVVGDEWIDAFVPAGETR